jgi:hypothetical protein
MEYINKILFNTIHILYPFNKHTLEAFRSIIIVSIPLDKENNKINRIEKLTKNFQIYKSRKPHEIVRSRVDIYLDINISNLAYIYMGDLKMISHLTKLLINVYVALKKIVGHNVVDKIFNYL